MKKLIFIIPVLLTLPSYADIASNANSATCDSGTIGATSGSTGLEANWNANTITIDWYNGDTKITTNTCSYDGAVTIPATPTRAGYTFNGWHVRVAVPACYTLNNQTTCNANSANGCTWDGSSCYYSISCDSFSDESTCNANVNCAYDYYHDSCVLFTGGTRCNTITTENECGSGYSGGNGLYWYSPDVQGGTTMCSWDSGSCRYMYFNVG